MSSVDGYHIFCQKQKAVTYRSWCHTCHKLSCIQNYNCLSHHSDFIFQELLTLITCLLSLSLTTVAAVFSHRFVLTDADHYVLTYLEANSNDIPSETLDSLRQKLSAGTAHNQPGDQNDKIQSAELPVNNTFCPAGVTLITNIIKRTTFGLIHCNLCPNLFLFFFIRWWTSRDVSMMPKKAGLLQVLLPSVFLLAGVVDFEI